MNIFGIENYWTLWFFTEFIPGMVMLYLWGIPALTDIWKEHKLRKEIENKKYNL